MSCYSSVNMFHKLDALYNKVLVNRLFCYRVRGCVCQMVLHDASSKVGSALVCSVAKASPHSAVLQNHVQACWGCDKAMSLEKSNLLTAIFIVQHVSSQNLLQHKDCSLKSNNNSQGARSVSRQVRIHWNQNLYEKHCTHLVRTWFKASSSQAACIVNPRHKAMHSLRLFRLLYNNATILHHQTVTSKNLSSHLSSPKLLAGAWRAYHVLGLFVHLLLAFQLPHQYDLFPQILCILIWLMQTLLHALAKLLSLSHQLL